MQKQNWIEIEDACTVYRQNPDTGDLEIYTKQSCDINKVTPDFTDNLIKRVEEMKIHSGQIRIICNTEIKYKLGLLY